MISGSTAAEAADADFVIVIAGLTAGDEGEEYTGASDREHLSLGDTQNNLIRDVIALDLPKAVIVQAKGHIEERNDSDLDDTGFYNESLSHRLRLMVLY